MLPAIAGTETLTIVMSSISMKLDTPTAIVSSTSEAPCNGGYSPGAAAPAAGPLIVQSGPNDAG